MCAADGGQPVACAGKDQCPGSEKCCIDLLGAINQNACPHTLAWSDFEKTKCSPECSVNSKQLCRNDSECTTGKCRQVDVATGIGLLITLGACFQ